jgi:site-specific DNA recombinase
MEILEVTKSKQVVIYGRVSTEEQKEGQNIRSQVDVMKKFIEDKEYVLVKEYLDEGWSGGILERPKLDELRDDARKGLFSAVVVNDVDRLSRDSTYLGIIIKDLQKNKVDVIFRSMPSNGNSPADSLFVGILGQFAEFEKAMIADRTRRGRKYKAERGVVVGTLAPFGYRYVKNDRAKHIDGYYEIIPQEAETVKLMFDLIGNKGMSARGLVKELMRRGLPTRMKKDTWGESSVLRVLNNSTYTGVTYFNKYQSIEPKWRNKPDVKYHKHLKSGRERRPKKDWIPIRLPKHLRIIDDELFERVQKIIQSNRIFSLRNSKYHYLLRAMIRCGVCGCLLHGCPCHGKTFYRCSNRSKKFPLPKDCDAKTISTGVLEDVVWNEVVKYLFNPGLIIQQAKNLRESKTADDLIMEDRLKSTDLQLGRCNQSEQRLLEAFQASAISIEQLRQQNSEINKEKERLMLEKADFAKKKEETVPKAQAIKSVQEYCNTIKDRLANLTFEEKQKFLRSLINGITLTGNEVRIEGEIPAFSTSEFSHFKSQFANFSAGKCQIENIISRC